MWSVLQAVWPGATPRETSCASRILAYAHAFGVRIGIPTDWCAGMALLPEQPLIRWARRIARGPPPELVLNALVTLAGAGCPIAPFEHFPAAGRVALPRDDAVWDTASSTPAELILRRPFWASTWDMLDAQARIIAQWVLRERQRASALATADVLVLTCGCGSNFSLDRPHQALASPRPTDVSAKWTFLSGRCSHLDVMPAGEPRLVRNPDPSGAEERIQLWDENGQFLCIEPRSLVHRALHSVGLRGAVTALRYRHTRLRTHIQNFFADIYFRLATRFQWKRFINIWPWLVPLEAEASWVFPEKLCVDESLDGPLHALDLTRSVVWLDGVHDNSLENILSAATAQLRRRPNSWVAWITPSVACRAALL